MGEATLVKFADDIKLGGKKPMHWRAGLPSRGTWVEYRKVAGGGLVQFSMEKSPAPGKSERQAAGQARHGLPGQQLCR